MAEVHDLGALRLQDPADDVDGRVVPVKKRRGADKAQRCARGIGPFVDAFGRAAQRVPPSGRPDSLAAVRTGRPAARQISFCRAK
jgi:hypothetical protein